MAEQDDAEPNVISLVGRPPRSQPAEAEDEADAERREHAELEEEIARLQRDLAHGQPAARDLLTGARNRHAMGTFLLGDHAAAFAEWREIIDDDPAPPDLLLTRAIFHKAAGDPGAAAADYERAAQISPLDAEIYLLRGQCHVDRGDHERASADFRRVMQMRPRDPTGYLWLAKSLTGRGDHGAAIRVCGRAIKLTPWRADLYELRGSCFRALGSWTEARADYDQCLARAPDNLGALRVRAMLHGFAQDHDRAIEDLSRALVLDPDDSTTLHARALAHATRGELHLAIADFTRGLAHDPESPGVFLVGQLGARP